jgi:hypothetical protein
MTHIYWVARQNKVEIPRDKDEVNKREIHECDGRAQDLDTMVAPLTPKPTRKSEPLAILGCHRPLPHDVKRRCVGKWPLPRYCCVRCILETKTKVGSTTASYSRVLAV